MNDLHRRRGAAVALAASGAVYLTAEFIAAAAWTDPPYSYTYHYISDLGVHGPVTAFGQYMYSPLAWVANTGFFLFGVAALIGVLLLPGLPGRRRWPMRAVAVPLAAGSILVALFPGSGDTGGFDFHALGAMLAFVAGNTLAILLGRAHRPLGVSPGLGRTLTGLGIIGLVFLAVFLGAAPDGLIGLVERGIIYPYLIGYILLGAALRPVRGRTD